MSMVRWPSFKLRRGWSRSHAALFAVVLCLGAGCAAPLRDTPRVKHVVLIVVDDLGWRDVDWGAHMPAEPLLATPAVASLAAEGLVFTDGYASAPVCTPTRTSLMTGASPARNHITYWTLHSGRDTSREHPSLRPPAWNTEGLQPGDVTLAGLMSDAGFRTIHVGKAHLGAMGTDGSEPRNLGFDVNVAGHGAGAPASYLGSEDFSRGQVWDVPGLDRWHGQDVFLTEALTTEAVEHVEAAVRDDESFFLHFAPYAVHTPIMANPAHIERFADRDEREAAYASMVASVDAAVGDLLSTLDRLGIADETLVVFTSDNGGLSALARGGTAHVHNAPLRSGKGSGYEGGVRVPWIVRWPGVTQPGSVSSVPVVTHDLFPTVLAAAGVDLPADHALDGADMSPAFTGRDEPFARALLWHQPHQWGASGPGIQPYSALRHGSLKIIWWHGSGAYELYDVVADPGETDDLASLRPNDLAAMRDRLAAGLLAHDAQPSRDRESGAELQPPPVRR